MDVKRLERKAYMSFHQDGLWDIFVGLMLIAWGLSMTVEMAGLAGVWFVVLFPLLMAAKRRLTYPRLGYAEFPRARRAKTGMVILFSVTALLGVLVAFLFTLGRDAGLGRWLREYFEMFFGGLLAVVVCVIAYLHLIKRMYAYAAVIFLSFSALHWLDVHLKYSFLVSGAIIFIAGLLVLGRFWREYPLPSGDPFGKQGEQR